MVQRPSHPDQNTLSMNDIFEMLGTITRRRKADVGSPFASPKATEKWLKQLHAESDYDAHHALVEGLERFNAENQPASLARMKSLLKLEEAGLQMQQRIVEQYVRNQATFRLARQALWRETWAFWSLLAEAWLAFLKHGYRSPGAAELKPHLAQIATRAIRYAGLVMRWDYHQTRGPAESAWRRVHKIYRLVERDEYATQEVTIEGQVTHCAREYTLIVLMGLVHPLGFRAQEIEQLAQILEAYDALPLPTTVPCRSMHTHMVDLSLSEGACVLDNEWVQGRRLRYFALGALVAHLKSLEAGEVEGAESGLTRQAASLIECGGVRRNRHRTHRFGRMWVAAGMDRILDALARPDANASRADLEAWMLRDESAEGMGFALPAQTVLPHGRLIAVSWDPAEGMWQLLAIRWNREENGQHLVGGHCLSRHPKRVEIYFEPGTSASAPGQTWAVFLPMSHAEHGESNLLIPRTHYQLGALLMLREGDVVYRLRLGEVQETHENWVRVAMDVIGREQFAAAA